MNRIALYAANILLVTLVYASLSACSLSPVSVSVAPTIVSQQTVMPQSSTNEGQIAQAIFKAINHDRVAAGLSALQWSNQLAASAHQHNLAMKAANTLSHQLPNEAAFGDRERQQGVQWVWAAENIGQNTEQTQAGALALHQSMMAEKPPDDGHRQNILTKTGTLLGVDILIDNQNHQLWLTEDFAKL